MFIRSAVRAAVLVTSVCLLQFACSDSAAPPVAVTLSISPSGVVINALGDTVQLTVAVKDQNGAAPHGVAVTWTSSNDAVATVSPDGLVTSVANGATTITASAGPANSSASVTVQQMPATVRLTPDAR